LVAPATATPAATVSVRLSPSSIVANGTSTSIATATVNNAGGHPVGGETIVFSASDDAIHFGSVTDHDDGTYTASVTSSTVDEEVEITATDTSASPNISGSATLTQRLAQSTTSLLVSPPDALVTNEEATLIATITSSLASAPPVGTITFEDGGNPIGGCGGSVAPSAQSVTVTCQTPLPASESPAQLTAVFTPSAGSGVAGSASPAASVAIGLDQTSTSLELSKPAVSVGARVTYTATVMPTHSGPVKPSGRVEFLDQGQPIIAC
jgi:adhesin/invasin